MRTDQSEEIVNLLAVFGVDPKHIVRYVKQMYGTDLNEEVLTEWTAEKLLLHLRKDAAEYMRPV